MFLTRDEIVAKRWPVDEVPLPDFEGRKVRVKTLSAAELLKLADLEKAHPNKGYALWWVASVCDEDGRPLFGEGDIDFITSLPMSSVNAVVEAAQRLNRVPKDRAEGKPEPIPSAA